MLIDVSMTIKEGSVFRLGTPAVQITSQRFHHESEGEYESVMISFSAHTATHVDLVFMEKRIDPERMIGKGKLIDVSQVPGREIQLADVEHQVEIESGDFFSEQAGASLPIARNIMNTLNSPLRSFNG